MNRRRLVFLAVVLLLCTAGTLLAAPAYEYDRYYFTDASKVTMCGFQRVRCNFSTWWGCNTAYYSDEVFNECGAPVEPWP